jgi:hypothetical protein
MDDIKDKSRVSILMIPVVVVNGIASGMISVVTAYFFKPLWEKAVEFCKRK